MAEEAGDVLVHRLCELASRVDRLEARLDALESAGGAAASLSAPSADLEPAAPDLPRGTPAFVGRTLLVLAGGYGVRALTDGAVLPAAAGVALGIGYAAFWQLRADREAAAGRKQSAGFHDVASSLIAFPLVWEAATRFGLLPPAAAALAVLAFFGLGLAVAWRRRLPANAAVTTLLALATVLALLVSTRDVLSAVLSLAAILAALEWLATAGAWPALRWPAAALLDGTGLLLVAIALRQPAHGPAITAVAAVLALAALPAVAVASIAARAFHLQRCVSAYDIVQAGAAVLVGCGGAVRLLAAAGAPLLAPGVLILLLGLAAYAAAFAHAERVPGRGRNFYFFSSAAGLLTIGGTSLVVPVTALPVSWAVAGLVAALLGRRFDRMTLRTHGALFLAAASVQAGLLSACARSLGGAATVAATPAAWATAAAAAAAWWALATDPAAPRSGVPRAPQLLLALVAVVALAKLTHAALAFSGGDWLARDAGAAAAAGTAVLSLVALGLAAGSWRSRLPELGWLVYPVLVAAGLKLVAQDLRDGRPATLVLSLTAYGLALALAPRLLGRRSVHV